MTIQEMKARLGEISNEMTELKNVETLSTEQVESVRNLSTEATNLKNSIEAKEAIETTLAAANVSTRKTTPAPMATAKVSGGVERKLENGNFGYNRAGDYFKDVRNFALGESSESLLKARKFQNAQRESVGSDGGFLVPTDLIDGVQSAVESDESLLSRTRQFNISGNKAEMRINEKAPWTGNGENITAYWTAEGKKIDESQAKFEDVTIKAEKLAALVKVTEEMAEDSALIESFIRMETPEVFVAAINNAIINGNGVGKPEGVLNSKFGFEVSKKVGQAADSVVYDNLKAMYGHALPRAQRNGIFIMNAALTEELMGMSFDENETEGKTPIYLPNNSIAGAPYGTLLGKPVHPMIGAMPALGDKGDICFVDLSYYYTVLKVGGLKQRISTDFLFDTDEMAFKYTFRMGGKCPFGLPQGTENGDYKLSGLTFIQERA